jgi:hypothetical protein
VEVESGEQIPIGKKASEGIWAGYQWEGQPGQVGDSRQEMMERDIRVGVLAEPI